MTNVKCGTTHYAGCPCHEAKRDAEIEQLRAALKDATDVMIRMSNLYVDTWRGPTGERLYLSRDWLERHDDLIRS